MMLPPLFWKLLAVAIFVAFVMVAHSALTWLLGVAVPASILGPIALFAGFGMPVIGLIALVRHRLTRNRNRAER
jgi:putative effector of murein hydrolase LrgA (UPF0299 family)